MQSRLLLWRSTRQSWTKRRRYQKRNPRHRAIDYILFTLDSIRDISDNVTPLAKSFCCNILLSSALATPIAWFWNIRILIVDFGSEVRPCCNGDCCTHALTCLSFPICPGTPDLFHHHPDHPVVIIGFLFRQKSLEFCYLPQHCPPRCFRPLYMHRPEPPVNIFRSLFIFHRVPIGYPCTIGYGMDRIWFSMSLHGSLCFQQLMAWARLQIDFLVGIRQSVGKPLFTPFFSDQPSLIYRPSISIILFSLYWSRLCRESNVMNLHPSFMRVNNGCQNRPVVSQNVSSRRPLM
jgi:hypothetical protein